MHMTANTRLKFGLCLSVGGNLLFYTSFWIAWMPWSASFKATLWTILFFATEAGTVACVAMIGKENCKRLERGLLQTWRKWRGKQPGEATPTIGKVVTTAYTMETTGHSLALAPKKPAQD